MTDLEKLLEKLAETHVMLDIILSTYNQTLIPGEWNKIEKADGLVTGVRRALQQRKEGAK